MVCTRLCKIPKKERTGVECEFPDELLFRQLTHAEHRSVARHKRHGQTLWAMLSSPHPLYVDPSLSNTTQSFGDELQKTYPVCATFFQNFEKRIPVNYTATMDGFVLMKAAYERGSYYLLTYQKSYMLFFHSFPI